MRKPKSARRACPVWSIRMLSFTRKDSKTGKRLLASKTYAFEIPVDHSPLVNIDQPFSNVFQLYHPICLSVHSKRSENVDDKHTRSNRSTFGYRFKNSLMLPLTIQSDTIANCDSDIVTPMRDKILGCCRDFHVTTSLQNLYMRHRQQSRTQGEDNQQLTPSIFFKLSEEYVLTTFTATSRPQYSPFHTSALPPR